MTGSTENALIQIAISIGLGMAFVFILSGYVLLIGMLLALSIGLKGTWTLIVMRRDKELKR